MDNQVQQIKERIDIVELVSSYLKLEKTGINWRAKCPFHQEKGPSFFVSPTRQSFKCFGCGVGGDAFEFVMKIEGIEFGDALRTLAKRAGVELKQFHAHPELATKRARLTEICELACRFYEKQLAASQAGRQAGDYLQKRGLTGETIKKWRLGYSPDEWRGLSDFLVSRNYARDEIVEAGLAVKSEKSDTPYDRFRGRIMFPVFDLQGQVAGFGGRITEEQKQLAGAEAGAKYLNTANTELYDKSRVLYGLNFAKTEIRKKDACILTEGYMDVILSHQAGFENTVAASGTALSPYQLQIIKRYTENLLVAFDMDLAGGLATQRGIDLAQKQGFEIKVILMTLEKDPADIIQQNPGDWEKAVSNAQEIMSFYFSTAQTRYDAVTPKGKKEIADFLLPQIKKISNSILQNHWVRKLADIIEVSEQAVFEELKKTNLSRAEGQNDSSRSQPAANPVPKAKERKFLLQERVLSLVLKNPAHLNLLTDDRLDCFSAEFKNIFAFFKTRQVQTAQDLSQITNDLQSQEQGIRLVLESCLFLSELYETEDSEAEMQTCLSVLAGLRKQRALADLALAIKQAELSGDEAKSAALMQEFNQLAKIK
ncbi:MAG: DNA primase [Patescibacteria group bacterium]|nr:DNA primase [Patescibacteria group bacterium]